MMELCCIPVGHVICLDKYRELEFRWVERLRDGREGLGTPYFDTYYDDMYQFKVDITPSVKRNQV